MVSRFRKNLSLALARQVLEKKHSDHNVRPASRAQRLDANPCPLEKDSSKKNATPWRKNVPKQLFLIERLYFQAIAEENERANNEPAR